MAQQVNVHAVKLGHLSWNLGPHMEGEKQWSQVVLPPPHVFWGEGKREIDREKIQINDSISLCLDLLLAVDMTIFLTLGLGTI